MAHDATLAVLVSGPQEGVCNWCGQLGGMRVGKFFFNHHVRLSGPRKINQLQTSGGTLCALLYWRGRSHCLRLQRNATTTSYRTMQLESF